MTDEYTLPGRITARQRLVVQDGGHICEIATERHMLKTAVGAFKKGPYTLSFFEDAVYF